MKKEKTTKLAGQTTLTEGISTKEIRTLKLQSANGHNILEFDLDLLNKRETALLSRIIKEHKQKNLKILTGTDRTVVVYPKRGGLFFQKDISFLEKALMITPNKSLGLKSELNKFIPRINIKEFYDICDWSEYASSIKINQPRAWGVSEQRWIKTLKIIYLASHLEDFVSMFERLPEIKAIRSVINNIESPVTDSLIVTNNTLIIKNSIEEIEYEGNTERITMVVYQEVPDLVPGKIRKQVMPENKTSNPSPIDIRVSKSRLYNDGRKPSVAIMINSDGSRNILLNTGCFNDSLITTSTYEDSKNIDKEILKEITKRLSISLQYPLEYIEW